MTVNRGKPVLFLLLAGIVGGVIALGLLWPHGLSFAILGMIGGGAACIGLAGAWLAFRGESTPLKVAGSMDDGSRASAAEALQRAPEPPFPREQF